MRQSIKRMEPTISYLTLCPSVLVEFPRLCAKTSHVSVIDSYTQLESALLSFSIQDNVPFKGTHFIMNN